jgi:hypothetical protein
MRLRFCETECRQQAPTATDAISRAELSKLAILATLVCKLIRASSG